MRAAHRFRFLIGFTALVAGWTPHIQAAERWEGTITPYFWASGVDGTVDIGPTSANFDSSFSDVWKELNIGG